MNALGACVVATTSLAAFGCGTTNIVQYVQPAAFTVHTTVAIRAPEPPTVAASHDDGDDDVAEADEAAPAVRPSHVIHLGYGYQLDPRPAEHIVVPAQCCNGCGVCAPPTVFTPTNGWAAGAGGWVALPDDTARR